jgi:hypothetical protein
MHATDSADHAKPMIGGVHGRGEDDVGGGSASATAVAATLSAIGTRPISSNSMTAVLGLISHAQTVNDTEATTATRDSLSVGSVLLGGACLPPEAGHGHRADRRVAVGRCRMLAGDGDAPAGRPHTRFAANGSGLERFGNVAADALRPIL